VTRRVTLPRSHSDTCLSLLCAPAFRCALVLAFASLALAVTLLQLVVVSQYGDEAVVPITGMSL